MVEPSKQQKLLQKLQRPRSTILFKTGSAGPEQTLKIRKCNLSHLSHYADDLPTFRLLGLTEVSLCHSWMLLKDNDHGTNRL